MLCTATECTPNAVTAAAASGMAVLGCATLICEAYAHAKIHHPACVYNISALQCAQYYTT